MVHSPFPRYACALALLVFCGNARALTVPRGSSELAVAGSIDRLSVNDENGDDLATLSEASLGLGWSRAITDRLQFGATFGMLYRSIDVDGGGSASESALRFTVDGIMNLPGPESAIPFAKLSFGFIRWNDDGPADYETTLILPMVGAGMRFPVGDRAAVVGLLGLEYQLNAQGSENIDGWDLGLSVGISVFPGGLR